MRQVSFLFIIVSSWAQSFSCTGKKTITKYDCYNVLFSTFHQVIQVSASAAPAATPSSTRRRRLRDLPSRRAAAAAATSTGRAASSSSAATASSTTRRCPVCFYAESGTGLIPCGHCACSRCIGTLMDMAMQRVAIAMRPVCRTNIRDIIKL